ncbi:MAG: putative addiction module antidote protein [Azoarcus sp.]|jgi:probable addiction module antidote protein|nr:putative addiction module antidote protein [Azoarcus sp.]
MTEKIKISSLKRFDITEHLDSEDAIAEYLTLVLEENDPVMLAAALGDVARARGMTQLARDTGLSRESLYKGLSGNRVPSADTLLKVIRALGFDLTITAKHAAV